MVISQLYHRWGLIIYRIVLFYTETLNALYPMYVCITYIQLETAWLGDFSPPTGSDFIAITQANLP